MGRGSKRTSDAVAETASLDEATAAAGAGTAARRGPGGGDPLIGDLRRGGLLQLLVLHYVAQGPTYGNQLMERISELTAGAVAVNPNTMYPLLRTLEADGCIRGEWEHPERRSRRFYRITEKGEQARGELAAQVEPRLDAIAHGIDLIRAELRDPAPPRREAPTTT
jgi:PadR family transcriptional regulator, regulatory protein PadR